VFEAAGILAGDRDRVTRTRDLLAALPADPTPPSRNR
jgi:hypothetical protein